MLNSRIEKVLTSITDPSIRETVKLLLNIIESQNKSICELRKENQQFKDEINKLKGEQGKPDIRARKKGADISSENERKQSKLGPETHKSKKAPIEIDKEIKCEIDTTNLPSDARFLRYDTLISQDLKLVRCNKKYFIEVYYSPSEHKTYRAEIPAEWTGYFSADLKSLIHVLTHACDVTNSKVLELLRTCGIEISTGSLTNILLEEQELLCNEKNSILKAGLTNSYCGADSTGSKEKGISLYTQVICNEYFTVFSSLPSKSRLNILAALQGEPEKGILYSYNETSRTLLDLFSISKADKEGLSKLFKKRNCLAIPRIELDKMVKKDMPGLLSKKNMYIRVCESLAIGYYHEQSEFLPVKYLLTDDAPEYQKIATNLQALCWVHDARAYKKLTPILTYHRQILNNFMQEYWSFYRDLLAYKILPSHTMKQTLEEKFETIFTKTTSYFNLDERIERTYANKEKLLAVLTNTCLPLHNNASELGARRVVVKRNISLHTISKEGTKVKDAAMTIIETAKKLKVNYIDYLADRISGKLIMPPLAQLILQQSSP